MFGQHFSADETRLSRPFLLGLRHGGHGAYQAEIGIALFQHLKCLEKRCIFLPPVGIEEIQLVGKPVMIGLPHNADKGRDSNSTGQEYSRSG